MRTGSKRVAGELGVVTKGVVPVRAEPDSSWKIEQVTQALIGQPVIAEGGQGDWRFVQCWDTYRGWIPNHSVRVLEKGSGPYASAGPVAIIRELWVDVLDEPTDRAGILLKATISAELEVARAEGDWVELRLPDDRSGFIRRHEARLVDRDVAQTIWLPDPAKLVETAVRLIGVPYLWGGTSPFGIDCSGFVQLIYRIRGVTLLRDAGIQASDERAAPVEKENIRTGDLVFFGKGKDPDYSCITHVGMALDNERFIHSASHSGVMTSPFADPYYSSVYWGARRMRLATLDPGGGAPDD